MLISKGGPAEGAFHSPAALPNHSADLALAFAFFALGSAAAGSAASAGAAAFFEAFQEERAQSSASASWLW